MSETDSIPTDEIPAIERSMPNGDTHELASQEILDRINDSREGKQGIQSLAGYLAETAGKPRGSGEGTLNSHFEEFLIQENGEIKVVSLADLQQKLSTAGVELELLGLESIGNDFQRVSAVVRDVDQNNPKSGYERPIVTEGPHMFLAVYAIDESGELHLFRTIQYTAGEAVLDTARGYADSDALATGEQMYHIEDAGERIKANAQGILKDETGKRFLKMKRIVFLGAPRDNARVFRSKSAVFGVEVDYNSFLQNNNVMSEEEFKREREQLEHEGIIPGLILDMNLDQYANYRRDSSMSRETVSDFPTDTVFIDFAARKLEAATRVIEERQKTLQTFVGVMKEMKRMNPVEYKNAWLKVMDDLNIQS